MDISKYPRMAAMLARRNPESIGKVHAPMREIPDAWSFDADGIRKNVKQIASKSEKGGKENGNQDDAGAAQRASEDADLWAIGHR